MRQTRYRFIVVLVLLLFASLAVRAQQNSEIVGTITDQTGAFVPGANLTLKQRETGFVYNATSNATGGYVFAGLNVGTYELKVAAKGFEAYQATGLSLNVSQTLATDVKLTVGAETVEVSVTADALQVQTESNEVSTLISGEQVTSIATANRNFTALAALGLGVSSNLPSNNAPSASASSASIEVNGLRENHNIWLLDGAEADDRGGAGGMSVMPSMDSIAEFQVLASNYPPDYGIVQSRSEEWYTAIPWRRLGILPQRRFGCERFLQQVSESNSRRLHAGSQVETEHLRRQHWRPVVYSACVQHLAAEDVLLL
jgi:hypothetical protein